VSTSRDVIRDQGGSHGAPGRVLGSADGRVRGDGGASPWWYVPGYNDWEQAIVKELAPCWACERNADDAARTIAPIVNELVKQRSKAF
jgi:hypothetical protein